MTSNAATWHLEVGKFPVRQLAFADQTAYGDHTLSIDRAALLAHLAEPQVIAHIEVELAQPGESCRIVHVLDAVHPDGKSRGALDRLSWVLRACYARRAGPQSSS